MLFSISSGQVPNSLPTHVREFSYKLGGFCGERFGGFACESLKMMLRTGDLNLNQLGDPVKDTVKRTILQHEIIFKSQVQELHRLYWTQKNLMRELYRSEAVGSARVGNVVRLEEVKAKFVDLSDDRRRGFNLELPVDDVYNGNSGKNSVGPEIVRPGFSSKGAVEGRRGGMVPLLENGKNLYCYEVIDLEEETAEMRSHVEACGASLNEFRIPTQNCRVIVGSGSDIASDIGSSSRVQNETGSVPYSARKEHSFVPDLNLLHAVGCNEMWQEQKIDISGAGGSESSVAGLVDGSTSSTRQQEPNSSKPVLIDLNITQDDEPSHVPTDPMLNFSSPSSSSSVIQNELLWGEQSNRYVKETTAAMNSDALYSASTGKSTDWLFHVCQDSEMSKVSDFGTKQENVAGNKVQESNSTGLTDCCRKSAEGFSSGSNGEVPNNANGTALSSIDFDAPVEENEDLSSSRLHSITHSDKRQTSIDTANNMIEDKQANHERSEDDTVSSHVVARDKNQQDGLSEKFLTERKSDVLTKSDECSLQDKVMDENSGTTQLEFESSLEKSCYVEEQHDSDCAVVDAAEILAGISLVPPASLPKQLNCAALVDAVINEDEDDLPHDSADSFETMTLELPEVSSNVHLTPTVQVEGAIAAGEGSCGVNKLRRGRGRAVRDFQKDILPGMVSLSRHEICEDMHSIGYELRKNRSRRGGGGNWVVPVRSRRSSRCPAGRRH